MVFRRLNALAKPNTKVQIQTHEFRQLSDWIAPQQGLDQRDPFNAEATAPRLNAHDAAWLQSLVQGLKHRLVVLHADLDGLCLGMLPLMHVRGPLFGSFLTSLPYLNTGGVWSSDPAIAKQLIDRACELADELDVRHLELRHEQPIEHEQFNFQRCDKVHLRLSLPETAEALNQSFKSKLRSQVKKSGQYDATVSFGGLEKLDDFYHVFARNMRDLGTPVYSKDLFRSIINSFQGDAEFCIVKHEQVCSAAGLLIHRRGLTEIPSASSLREFNRQGANMWMYWHALQRAIERGSKVFDFGRSSEGSGTYKFKLQWGSVAEPATWQYYVRKGDPAEMRPDSDRNQRLVKIWQRLPVWLTKWIGPSIVRGIP